MTAGKESADELAWEVGSRGLTAAALVVGVLLVGAGPALATSSGAAGGTETPYGVLRVDFDDQWVGSGQRTWTVETATSRAWWSADDNTIPAGWRPSELALVDEFCFSKYGFDSVSVGGSGLTAGAGAPASCGTRRGTADPQELFVTNSGRIIARGNYYGRWLWFQHRAQASVRIGSVNYFAEAYAKTSPAGYDV